MTDIYLWCQNCQKFTQQKKVFISLNYKQDREPLASITLAECAQCGKDLLS